MTLHAPEAVAVTCDVHSHLESGMGLLSRLDGLSSMCLLADSGDFMQGTGFYRLGGGLVEQAMLTRFYDVVAPGNHGFGHYLHATALRAKTVCANLLTPSGEHVFRPYWEVEISGTPCLVTGVMGAEAFAAIPAEERYGIRHVDSAGAVTDLTRSVDQHTGRTPALIVLSHSGWDQDLALARACPHLAVIFSGHCHSPNYGPKRVGKVLVLKGREHAGGYGIARYLPMGWQARVYEFEPAHGDLRAGLTGLHARITELARQLDEPVGNILEPYRDTTPTPSELLHAVARLEFDAGSAQAALLNTTALRPPRLGNLLTRGQVLETSPFDNRLAVVELADGESLADLAELIAPVVEPIAITGPGAADRGGVRVATTEYLARTHLRRPYRVLPHGLAERVAQVLTDTGGNP